ncbi:tyrosine-type recombinase/integrase [Ancylomarina sp. 16SWW S1-10-2]|uniref:tyrosine-type recombinase/integrase n=1 Tax=Ancylomarina sp. 16SWW S1-10-2 TaxID=2499681 RepID=UPI0012AE1880|nr:tyrosine-type recombinase/integrase [Ancylomarina sp. 16SWW S1-10-2]MRT92384.1 integrase [Ancylomarina sp. 16SWW S1-10-2]
MAISVTFILRDPQNGISPSKQKETLVYMHARFGYYEATSAGKKYARLIFSTEEKVKPHCWNPITHRAKGKSAFDFENFNINLENLEQTVRILYRKMRMEHELITPRSLKKRLTMELSEDDPNIDYSKDLNNYIQKFIDDIENGIRLNNKGERYKPGTTKNYKGFQVQFNLYQKERQIRLNFNNIDLDFYNDFINYFNKKDYSINTVGRHLKTVKAIMRASREEGLHQNIVIDDRRFKTLKTRVQNIYLTEDEIKTIANLDLSQDKELDETRDVFLIGYYTAQRFSDYSQIRKENIHQLDNGKKTIVLTQIKTGTRVVIPIKPDLMTILKKYNYKLPKIYESKFNDRIKKVVEKAEINEIIQIEGIKGGLKVKTNKPKYKFVSSHTARRSAISQLVLLKVDIVEIMAISGHKSPTELMNYVKLESELTAGNLTNNPFFQ